MPKPCALRWLVSVLAVFVAAVPSGPAEAIDPTDLIQEYRAYKTDPEIIKYLSRDFRAAQRIDKLQRILQQSFEDAGTLEQLASDARGRRAAALLGRVYGLNMGGTDSRPPDLRGASP